jgi:hypothetical protein
MRLNCLLFYIVILFSFTSIIAQTQKECGTSDKKSWFNELKYEQAFMD